MTTHPMMCTTGEMAEPRDMTLALHRVVVLGAHPVEASFSLPFCSPPPCPPPRAGKLVVHKRLPESQQQNSLPRVPYSTEATSPILGPLCNYRNCEFLRKLFLTICISSWSWLLIVTIICWNHVTSHGGSGEKLYCGLGDAQISH